MSTQKMVPSGSQTVGPYFRIGLEHLFDKGPVNDSVLETIELHGKVLDRDGAPVPDALLEFWAPDLDGIPNSDGHPAGFHRVTTDLDGRFSVALNKPGPTPMGDGRFQAPHMLVLVFARGLLRQLITRVYFDQDPVMTIDPVLLEVAAERRPTLIASSDARDPRAYEWNVRLQGDNETVFFAW